MKANSSRKQAQAEGQQSWDPESWETNEVGGPELLLMEGRVPSPGARPGLPKSSTQKSKSGRSKELEFQNQKPEEC